MAVTPQGRPVARTAVPRSFAALIAVIFFAIVMAVFVYTQYKSNQAVQVMRQNFCGYLQSVNAASHQLPQVPGRVHAEQAQTVLMGQLNCP